MGRITDQTCDWLDNLGYGDFGPKKYEKEIAHRLINLWLYSTEYTDPQTNRSIADAYENALIRIESRRKKTLLPDCTGMAEASTEGDGSMGETAESAGEVQEDGGDSTLRSVK